MPITLLPQNFKNFKRLPAEQFVQSFDRSTQTRASGYLRTNRVKSIDCLKAGIQYEAEILGEELYQTVLTFKNGAWTSHCTCPEKENCVHACALMMELLNQAPAAEAAPVKSAMVRRSNGPLTKLLPESFLSKLTTNDFDNIRRVEAEYSMWSTSYYVYSITAMTLRSLFPRLVKLEKSHYDLFPKTGLSALQFWHFILEFAKSNGQPEPAWLAPLNNTANTLFSIKEHERKVLVDQWKKSFTKLSQTLNQNPKTPTYSFRLRFSKKTIIPEWFDTKKNDYIPVPKSKLRSLITSHDASNLSASSGDWLTWQVIQQAYSDSYNISDFPLNESTIEAMRRLLENEECHKHVVTHEGAPFIWSDIPLTWSLNPTKEDAEIYQATLETPSGSKLTESVWQLAGLAGQPTYYLSKQTIYKGPVSLLTEPYLKLPLVVPHEAISSNQGFSSLIKLDCHLPEPLSSEKDVQRIKLMLIVRILEASDLISSERFTVQAVGVDPKNHDTILSTYDMRKGWSHDQLVREQGPSNKLYVEESELRWCETLVKPLRVTWYYDDPVWTGYLDKKFPERFIEWAASLPKGVVLQAEGELASILKSPTTAAWEVSIESTGVDWFDLSATLKVEDTTLTKEELKLLLKANGGFVRLSSGEWKRLLVPDKSTSFKELKDLGIDALSEPGVKHRLHALQLADTEILQESSEDLRAKIVARALEIRNFPKPLKPKTIQAQLRPYQLEGFQFLAYLANTNFGGVLADDMGLGKTLQTLTWLAWLRAEKKSSKPSLVVCPKSVMDNWQTESARFYPSLSVLRANSREANLFKETILNQGLVIINYAQLRSMEEIMTSVSWNAVILDEGQFIKNPDSQTAQTARKLKAEHRLVLTGTPIENRLLDLWSLLHFAMPGALANRTSFQRQYHEKVNPIARQSLGKRVRPFLLRRTKNQVARDLPDRIEEDIHCELEGDQLGLYLAHLKEARQILLKMKTERDLDKSRFNILSCLLRLRQACCHPDLINKNPKKPGESAKVEALMDLIEPLMEEGHKVLVFSQFVEMLSILKAEIAKREIPLFYLDGSTENRGALVDSFQKQEGEAVFLISLKAGGAGLNLTAASYVVLFDPWWNPAVEAQAIDRTHRIGQDKTVIAYRLIAKNTIEEKIRLLQKNKAQLFQDVLGEENFAKALNLDDFQYLLAEE